LEIADRATAKTVHQARLQFDARRWFAGKVAPKKYGTRVEHDGSIGLRHEDALDLLERLERQDALEHASCSHEEAISGAGLAKFDQARPTPHLQRKSQSE